MPKNKKRLLLVVIFAVAAGIIIANKLNQSIEIGPSEHKEDLNNKKALITTSNAPAPKSIETTPTVSNTDKLSNYLTLIPECLNLEVQAGDSLKMISDKNRWENKSPKNLIRQNLIYKGKSKEFRISIIPSETNKTWILQSFDVDNEGLPIPKTKTMGLQYYQLAEKIKLEKGKLTLVSDEQDITVDNPKTSGNILFINGEPTEIKLFNKSNQRLLECQGNHCICNQALSS